MPVSFDVQVEDALSLLPAEGEVEFDAYKAQLQEQNPDNSKAVFTHILLTGKAVRRLEMDARQGLKTLFLSRRK